MLRYFEINPKITIFMQKFYSEISRVDDVNKNLVPKEETIKFLLDYSMALSVIDYNKLKFEALLN